MNQKPTTPRSIQADRWVTKRCRSGRAFTVLEVLIVIGIIAVLVSLILPAIARTRTQGRLVMCASNLRQLGNAVTTYAAANDGNVPASPQFAGNWAWDMSRTTIDQLLAAGATREVFYCPEAYDRQSMDELWNFNPQFRVTGYFLMIKRPASNVAAPTAPKTHKRRLRDNVAAEDAEIATDVTLSQNGSYTRIIGGFGQPHTSSHTQSLKPMGGNVIFLDGHVAWRPFSDMKVRSGTYNPQHWF